MHCGGGLWYNVGMTARYPSSIREEELKNKVAADFFGAFAPIPSDSFDDTDHDILLDYDEVYDCGMDSGCDGYTCTWLFVIVFRLFTL